MNYRHKKSMYATPKKKPQDKFKNDQDRIDRLNRFYRQ